MTVATAMNQPVALYYRVRMMLAQMVVVLLAMGSVFLLPLHVGAMVLTALYGALLVAERRLSIRSPLTLATFLLSAVVLALELVVDVGAWGIYVPAAYFGVLFVIGAACLLRGHPASLYYSGGRGSMPLHWRTSGAWVLIAAAGLTAGLLLPLRPGLFWLLPALSLAGVLLTLWLQLVNLGVAPRRQRSFCFGGFRFEEVPSRRDALVPFYSHYVREATHSLKQGRTARHVSFQQLLQLKMDSDASSWPRIRFFVAREGEEIVGTISCTMKTDGVPLGVESAVDAPISLAQLQAYGRVMQVARFTINPRYRLRPEVFRGLLRSVIEYALENDVAFLVTQAYESVGPIYSKIGFRKIRQQVVHVNDTGAPVVLMAFNLAKRVVCDSDDAGAGFRLEGALSPYLSERYFKRQSLRSLFVSRPGWAIPDDELPQVCLGTPSCEPRERLQHGT